MNLRIELPEEQWRAEPAYILRLERSEAQALLDFLVEHLRKEPDSVGRMYMQYLKEQLASALSTRIDP